MFTNNGSSAALISHFHSNERPIGDLTIKRIALPKVILITILEQKGTEVVEII